MRTKSLTQFAETTGYSFRSTVDRSRPTGPGVTLRFLGTAGFVLETADRTLALDPYITRPSFSQHLRGPLFPDRELVLETIPRCHDVLIGHSHSDHLLDAPILGLEYGARIIGTETTRAIVGAAARHAGVEIETLVTNGGEDIPCGSVTVRGIPSKHAPIGPPVSLGKYLGDGIPFPGTISLEEGEKLEWPLHVSDFKEGGVLDWMITTPDLHVLHIDSAKFVEDELDTLDVENIDVLCLCAVGWQKGNENYVPYLLQRFRPRIVIPCHWDVLFDRYHRPKGRETRVWGISKLDLFLKEIEAHSQNTEVVLLDFDGIVSL